MCTRSFQIAELLSFPQYLREHDDAADTYGRLKLAAVAEGDFHTTRYMARKHDWIRSTVREALAHYRGDQRARRLWFIT